MTFDAILDYRRKPVSKMTNFFETCEIYDQIPFVAK